MNTDAPLTSSRPRVGLIGLGLMGSAIATRLVQTGFEVIVHDVSHARVSELVGLGAVAGEGLREVAGADVVGICVPNGRIMREIVADSEFVAGLREGSTVVDFSTVDPADSRDAAAQLVTHGVRFIDTPVARTVEHALRGELLVMAGAHEKGLGHAGPVLAALAEQVVHCGEVGGGAAMKLVNNLCNQTILFATLEAFHVARALGLSDDLVFSVLRQTNADNGHLRNAFPVRVFPEEFEGGFKLALAHKDIALAIAAANRAGAAVPVSGASLQATALAIAGGEGDCDSTAYIRWLTKQNVALGDAATID